MNHLLNIYIYSIVILFSIIIAPFVTLYVVFLKILFTERFFLRKLRGFIRWYGLIIVKVLFFPFIKVKFIDMSENENVAPCIFVCNHRSSSDPFLQAFLPYEIILVVNDWPFRIPVLGFMAKFAGYLSIKEMDYNDFFETVCKLLKQGVCIAAFPEGTRSGCNKMGYFHGAVFRVALKMKCPIVPICIIGNENIPSKDFVLHSGTIRMKRLPAIDYSVYKNMGPFKFKNYVRNIIADETASMEREFKI